MAWPLCSKPGGFPSAPSKCVRTSKIRADRWLHRRRSVWRWRVCADGEQRDKRGLVAGPDDDDETGEDSANLGSVPTSSHKDADSANTLTRRYICTSLDRMEIVSQPKIQQTSSWYTRDSASDSAVDPCRVPALARAASPLPRLPIVAPDSPRTHSRTPACTWVN